jgi:hypothetical protein
MEGLDSPSYSILNKKENLATPIPSSFMTPKLVLGVVNNPEGTLLVDEVTPLGS